jgi:hypothetical protein
MRPTRCPSALICISTRPPEMSVRKAESIYLQQLEIVNKDLLKTSEFIVAEKVISVEQS